MIYEREGVGGHVYRIQYIDSMIVSKTCVDNLSTPVAKNIQKIEPAQMKLDFRK
jgi:hypothetical protein